MRTRVGVKISVIHYNGVIYRPPIEADTFMIPVTEGCSYNRCDYCTMYRGIPFRMVKPDQIAEFLEQAIAASGTELANDITRVYLIGGDPFALSPARLHHILDVIAEYLPAVQTITMYASAANIVAKTDEQLRDLAKRGVNDLYIGVETGLDSALHQLNKESSSQQMLTQLQRLNAAGIRHRDLLMLGAAGRGHGQASALASAAFVNQSKPDMVMFTTMAAFPGTPLFDHIQAGTFTMASEREILMEERTFIEHVDVPHTLLRAGHVLDSVPLRGYLVEDKQRLLATLDQALATLGEHDYSRVFG